MNVWIMLSFTKNIVQLVQNLWTIQVCECFVGAYTTNMIKILSHQFVYAGGRRAAASCSGRTVVGPAEVCTDNTVRRFCVCCGGGPLDMLATARFHIQVQFLIHSALNSVLIRRQCSFPAMLGQLLRAETP